MNDINLGAQAAEDAVNDLIIYIKKTKSTMRAIAKDLGVSEATVSRWVKKERLPSRDNLSKIQSKYSYTSDSDNTIVINSCPTAIYPRTRLFSFNSDYELKYMASGILYLITSENVSLFLYSEKNGKIFAFRDINKSDVEIRLESIYFWYKQKNYCFALKLSDKNISTTIYKNGSYDQEYQINTLSKIEFRKTYK